LLLWIAGFLEPESQPDASRNQRFLAEFQALLFEVGLRTIKRQQARFQIERGEREQRDLSDAQALPETE
jgi:hypothetical protein